MGLPAVIPVCVDPATQYVSGVQRGANGAVIDLERLTDHFLPGASVYLSTATVETVTYRGRPLRRASTTAKDGFVFAGVVHPLQRRMKQTLLHLKVAKIKLVSSGVTSAWNFEESLKFPKCAGMMIHDGQNNSTVGVDLGVLHRGEIPGEGRRLRWKQMHRILIFPSQLRRLVQ